MKRFLLNSVKRSSKQQKKNNVDQRMNEKFKDEENVITDMETFFDPAVHRGADELEIKIGKEKETDDKGEKKGKILSLYQRVQKMSVPEKVQLAIKGDKEARGLLIRDSNKLVSTAVIKSPKISESEVQQIAQSTNVNEDILRIIAKNKEWTNKYKIRVKLVNNPRTPLEISLKIMKTLREKDLTLLSKNRNVPSILSKMAKKLVEQKAKH